MAWLLGRSRKDESETTKQEKSTAQDRPNDGLRPYRDTEPATLNINDIKYVSGVLGQQCPLGSNDVNSLATVIRLTSNEKVTEALLRTWIEDWLAKDDVFQRDFLRSVVFLLPTSDAKNDLISDDAKSYLSSLGNELVRVVASEETNLEPGLYLVANSTFFGIYRLYSDGYQAFLSAIIKSTDSAYRPLTAITGDSSSDLIAVPSRAVFGSGARSPLAGFRIAVKDNFHINGLRTSLCNRAYLDTYPTQTKTAVCLTKLTSLGANIVGTTKLAAFAATEEPIECIDFEAPWNPRADGYQSPAGSSSGSGVAVTSYDWIDVAIGSDTSGSGRRPAHWNGCFAVRPSHGVIDKDGFVKSFEQFDTPSFLARSLTTCHTFAGAWYGDNLKDNVPQLPYKVVIIREYMSLVQNAEQLKIIEDFTNDLEKSLGVEACHISLSQAWSENMSIKVKGEELDEYMKTACLDSFFYDDYHNLGDFRRDYEAKYSKAPYVSPPVRFQWELSATITRQSRDEAVNRLAVFKDWFAETVMESGKKTTIVVLPIENISPRYRDEATTHFVPKSVPMLFLSPILGAPECVVPIGQVPYDSRVSKRTESLPVGISLMGPPGTDLALLELVRSCLEQSNRPTEVLAGNTLFAK